MLTQVGLRWGQIVDVIDGADTRKVIATVISVEVRPGAHLPLVVPVEGAGEVGAIFSDLVTQRTQELYQFTVEDRILEIEKECAAKEQERKILHRRIMLAGGSVLFAGVAFVGAGPIVERWLKSQEEDPATALSRRVTERGPQDVANVLNVDSSIQKDPVDAGTFLSRLSPKHYDSLSQYAASAEVSESDALILLKVLHRLARLELSRGSGADKEALSRDAFERRFRLVLSDSPYQPVKAAVVDLLKSL
jgi:hypothetical protein